MSKKKIPLEPNKIYHVYNHAISNELLFRNDNNFEYFFKKYKEYIVPIADTFAYCLMPNHFHFSLKIKSEKELIKYYVQDRKLPESTNYKNFDDEKELLRLNSQQFGNFLNAYAKAYNKMYKRKGKLYWSEFERKLVDSDSYFRRLIHYIHFNPVFHGFVKDLRDWKYTSFESFFSNSASKLKRVQVIEWFEDVDKFYEYHKQQIDDKLSLDLESFDN